VTGIRALVFLLGSVTLLGAPSAAGASSPDTLLARLDVSGSVAKVGEPLRIRLTVPTATPGAHLAGPPAPAALGEFDLRVSEAASAGPDSAAWLLEVAFFEAGERDLPPLPFALETGVEGERLPVRVPTYRFSIVSSLSDTVGEADIRDIKGPIAPPPRWDWKRIAGALLLLLALTAALYLWRRRRHAGGFLPSAPSVPPEVTALRALSLLEEEALPARGRFEEHYVRLSIILRAYVEGRYRLPALESTTYEIQAALDGARNVRVEGADDLVRLLDEADLVKFAKARPELEAAGRALSSARTWVERNTPRPAAGEAA
jgi:hypothetical protein